jgi:hypothetical protein
MQLHVRVMLLAPASAAACCVRTRRGKLTLSHRVLTHPCGGPSCSATIKPPPCILFPPPLPSCPLRYAAPQAPLFQPRRPIVDNLTHSPSIPVRRSWSTTLPRRCSPSLQTPLPDTEAPPRRCCTGDRPPYSVSHRYVGALPHF